ncbi:MAG TPA: glycosyltransferase [Chthoniobacterales bacterium]
MNINSTKPKLVFFQRKYDGNLPHFLLLHKDAHVQCLSTFFDVTVVNYDCDYGAICERFQPELALFESGVNHATCPRLKISNPNAYPQVPKAGLHNADAWCDARAGFLSDMEEWGINTFFAICVTAAEHTPAIANNLYVWPNCIDPSMFHNYGEAKSIPVLFTGATNALYPWRSRIQRLVSARYPSLICPHSGYTPKRGRGLTLHGEQYARTINASMIVPTCGTIAREVVRKHFEIPACNACLVTEKSPGLAAAGFEDMINCVFADEKDITDKLDYLFGNRDVMEQISSAGHDLVHQRHTFAHRDQILQWYRLQSLVRPDERIIQRGPFASLAIVPKSSPLTTYHVHGNGLHLHLIKRGDAMLLAGKHDAAEALYLQCLNHTNWMPEPKLRLALSYLYRGQPARAMTWISGLVEYVLSSYKAARPDPVEWAYLIVAMLCLGELNKASQHIKFFPALHHPELDRVAWLVGLLCNELVTMPKADTLEGQTPSYSIHQLPSRSIEEWVNEICKMLRACRQSKLAASLSERMQPNPPTQSAGFVSSPARKQSIRLYRPVNSRSHDEGLTFSRERSPLIRLLGLLPRRLEKKLGYFLPYPISEMRNDEFFRTVQTMAQDEDLKNAVIIGAAPGTGLTEASLAGLTRNRTRPTIFCITDREGTFRRLQGRAPRFRQMQCRLVPRSPEALSGRIAESLASIRHAFHLDKFEAVVFDPSELSGELSDETRLFSELNGAHFIAIDDTNTLFCHKSRLQLLATQKYSVTAENPGLRRGYSILRIVR